MADNTRVSPFQRILYAFIGLFAGNAALLLYLLQNAVRLRAYLLKVHMGEPARQLPQAWNMFIIYAIFSLAGWALVGIPIALALPARFVSRLAWPLCLLTGAVLGPLALLLIFIVMFGLQGQLSNFSLARTESLWPLSVLVSTVSFGAYAALLRRRFRGKEQ